MSRILAVLTVLSTATSGVFDSIRRTLFAPLGRAFDIIFAPVDRLFEPFANAFNRLFGNFFGEMTGLQFFFLLLSVILLLTGGIWGEAVVLVTLEGLVVVDLRRALALGCIWAIFAMGWDIQSGYTGYISFGHSVLSGAAAYTVALLLVHVDSGLSYVMVTPIAVLAAMIVGLVIALPSLRLEGPYFSLITFIAVLLFYRMTFAFDGRLGGATGFQEPNYLVSPADPFMRYYMMLIPMLIIAVLLTLLARSNLGLVLTAIRENEPAVSAAGINATKFKLWSFVISSIPMGIGGVLLVGFSPNVNPDTFIVVNNSIEIIAMAVLGGMGSILGPLGGAFVFQVLNHGILGEFFDSGALRLMFLFLIVIGVLVLARDGLFRMIWHRLGSVRGDD